MANWLAIQIGIVPTLIGRQRGADSRKVELNCPFDLARVSVLGVMRNEIAKSGDLLPRDCRVNRLETVTQVIWGFAKDL